MPRLLQLYGEPPARGARSLPEFPVDRSIKTQLKQFKRLELAASKFAAKNSGLTQANVLRTLLLPYLRLAPPLRVTFASDQKVYLSFVAVSTAVLGLWWRQLLRLLSAPAANTSTADRTVFLECVSRIMARLEWADADPPARATHVACLADTLDYCVRLLLLAKVVLVATLAFVGKVFAYAFFYLPYVCTALLFLLNVKQSTVDAHMDGVLPMSPRNRAAALRAFPGHLAHLIDYRGLVRLERCKRSVINAVAPPTRPVAGIRDPSGAWVRRWSLSDSDVFNLFFRHYVALADASGAVAPEAIPGWHIVIAHVFQIVLATVQRGQPSDYCSKLFQTVRDINYLAVVCLGALTQHMDRVLVRVARSVSVYDHTRVGRLLNLVYEYVNYVEDTANMDWEFWFGCNYRMLTATPHVQTALCSLAFLFNVWDRVPVLLLQNEDPAKIPHLQGWFTDLSGSAKLNFADWLTSSPVWLVYLTHWNPIVRGYYMRLLIWRVMGVNSHVSRILLNTARRAKLKLDFIHESMRLLGPPPLNYAPGRPMINRKFCIVPMNPKFAAYADDMMTLTAAARSSDLRRTHPYEIFDEAIYTCTSHDPQSVQEEKVPNHLLVTLLSRFFKMLSPDDPLLPPRSLSRSKWLPSLLPSLSPLDSPTNLDNSLPTSTSLSVKSDLDGSSLLSDCLGSLSVLSQSLSPPPSPPELFKVPPEIVRPSFKFDFAVDHDAAAAQYLSMQGANASQGKFVRLPPPTSSIPKSPRVPCMSFYVSTDTYTRFQVVREEYLMDDVLLRADSKDLAAFSRTLALALRTPRDLMTMGRALNEWNGVVAEFEGYLMTKVETDQANYVPVLGDDRDRLEISEVDYLRRIIPLLSFDICSNMKLLNAA